MPAFRLACPRCKAAAQLTEAGGQPFPCPGCGALLIAPPAATAEPLWFYARDRRKVGPVRRAVLQQLAANGQLQLTDMLLQEGATKWLAAAAVPGLFPVGPCPPAPVLSPPRPAVQTVAPPVQPTDAALQQPLAETIDDAQATAPHVPAEPDRGEVPPPPPPDRVVISGYEVLGLLGRGGMGVVYKARHLRLKRLVALKMVLAGAHAGPAELGRFQQEAEAVARLQHPNIVQIFETGEHDGVPYIALEYIEGGSLAHKVGGRPQGPRPAARLVQTLAAAVHAAHLQGIIHRDLKPANILLAAAIAPDGASRGQDEPTTRTDDSVSFGEPKITDFGLAKRLQDDAGRTATGSIVGTPNYMAPEQAAGRNRAIAPATDVYALGAILYELLTGRPPFLGASMLDTLALVRSQEPIPPRQMQPAVPRDLETICLKCLQKEPHRRYASAEALGQDVGRFLVGLPISARPMPLWERGVKWARRRPAVAALLGVILLILACSFAGVLALMLQAEDGRQQAEDALGRAQTDFANEQAALKRAEQARNDAFFQRTQARILLARADNHLYYTHVARAQRLWHGDQAGTAEELIDECAPRLCHWEWYYLKRLCRSSIETLPAGERVVCLPEAKPGSRMRLITDQPVEKGKKELVVREGTPGQDGFVETRRLAIPHEFVHSLAVSADGKQLAVSCGAQPFAVKMTIQSMAPSALIAWDLTTGRQLFTRKRATGGDLLGLAFSPDGKHLAAGGLDGLVRLLEAGTGAEVRVLRGHPAPVTGVAFSPDGQRLASCGRATSIVAAAPIRVWNPGTGKELLTCLGHPGATNGIAFSPDGKWLASAGQDRIVGLWDAATGKRLSAFLGHSHAVLAVAFSPDGTEIASAGNDKSVRIWNVEKKREAFALRGHRGAVTSLAFSADGRYLAAASSYDSLHIWATATDPVVRTLRAHTGPVATVAFSPDGRRLASGGRDGPLRVWDAATGTESFALAGHAGGTSCTAFSPDGKHLASGGEDRTVRVWDPDGRREVQALRGHTARVLAVAYSPDGSRLASAGEDQTVRVWDAVSGRELLTFRGHRGPVTSVAFSPDGRRLASGSIAPGNYWDRRRGEVRLWDATTGAAAATLTRHLGMVRCLAFSPDGELLAIGSGKDEYLQHGEIKVLGLRDGEPLFALHGHDTAVYGLAFSPDGARLATAGKGVQVWDTATGQEIVALATEGARIGAVAFSPRGERLAGACADRTVKLWDAATGVAVRTLRGHRTSVETVLFTPDSKRLVSLAEDWSVKLWDTSSAREVGTQRQFVASYRAALSPDGKHLALTDRNPKGAAGTLYELRVQQTDTGQDVFRLPAHAWPVLALAYSADGGRLVTGCVDHSVKVWDVPSRSLLLTLTGHTGPVRDVAFSPDGAVLASCSEDRTVKIWNAADGRLLRSLGHDARATAVAFSPDGRRLASAGWDKVVTLWDPVTGKATRSLRHPAPVDCLRFSPDGGSLVSGTTAGVIYLWDPADGRLLLKLRDHRAAVRALAFSPDGQRLASSSADQTLKLWELVPWPRPRAGAQGGEPR